MTPSWWWFAKEDLEMAKVLLNGRAHLGGVTFHCQQAVEKMLKGTIQDSGRVPPRLHKLPRLLLACQRLDPACESLREPCRVLDRYYVPSRYPEAAAGSGPLGLPGLAEAAEAVRLAEEVWRFFQERRRPQVRERRVSYRRSPVRRRKK